MRQFILLLLLSFSFSLFSNAQSKIYFEDTELDFVLDSNDGFLLNTDTINMKNENQDTIEVAWFFTVDVPVQENPNNENQLESVWTVQLCDEVLCHVESSAQSIVPPNDEYSWKFSISAAFWLGDYELIPGEGKATLTVTNIADQTETTTLTVNLKIVAGGCMDETACNYDADATADNGSCSFVNDGCFDEEGNEAVFNEDCACVKAVCNDENACNNGEDGNCIFMDCLGECGGSAIAGTACTNEDGNEGEFGEDCACIAICNNENACNNGETGDCLFEDCTGECGGSAVAGSVCTDVNGNESVYDVECTCIAIGGTSIDEFIALSKPIFPNPTNNIINLQFADINHGIHSIKIINLQGQEMINLNGLDKKSAYQIDLSELSKGLYHINLSDDKGKLLYSEMIERH